MHNTAKAYWRRRSREAGLSHGWCADEIDGSASEERLSIPTGLYSRGFDSARGALWRRRWNHWGITKGHSGPRAIAGRLSENSLEIVKV
ncbi:hypothetical protein SAMN06272775_7119 [Streptomyces sp. 2323.1]|nr:hypothetical protein SAMN06272775_7119 [Streptomyces sp. 2323.1]